MSVDPPPATETAEQPAGIAEVGRLANLLAERILNAHEIDVPVPDAHMRALVKASLLLDEYGQEVPSLLAPIMDKLRAEAAAGNEGAPESDEHQGEAEQQEEPEQAAQDLDAAPSEGEPANDA